jgi:4,5-dihydroxyphthalate decarboxylase
MTAQVTTHTGKPGLVLSAALGRYPHVAPLRDGRVSSSLVELQFADVPNINRAFAPMVREQKYDVSEIAIATFLQAKSYGKPLVLLPVVVAARFQESALLCAADSDIRGPQDLKGKRIGVRAYSQTTGMWIRGILRERYGIEAADIRWTTFEGAHVAEFRDPPWVTRAEAGRDLVAMLKAGELDAIIVGNDVPADPALRTVFPDPAASGEGFLKAHGMVPINHMVAVRQGVADAHPEAVQEILRMLDAGKALGARPQVRDPLLRGKDALEPCLSLALRYVSEQGLLARPLTVSDVWQGLPAGVG